MGVVLNLFLCLYLCLFLLSSRASAQLKIGFYQNVCPHAEMIVKDEMTKVMSVAPSIGGPLLRMHFHDCFVNGCEGSVLLNTTDNSKPTEKQSIPNLSLRGFEVVDRVKARLEKECPGIVSCADIVAIVARDVVSLAYGPQYEVYTGRRDGRVSKSQDALNNLPPFFANISALKQSFKGKGLSVKDLVVLSGAHTIGIGHCSSFDKRIYNFTGRNDNSDTDPTLDNNYVPKLRIKCKKNDTVAFVEMDPGSSKTFDTSYYNLVAKRRGLFQSDSALLDDPETKNYVIRQALYGPTEFFKDFGVSMVNMGNIGVLTGTQGEIRKHCAFVN